MNIWSLLGVSVAITALFSIAFNELCRDQAFYESYRWFLIVGFGWLGVILFIWGRWKSSRQTRRFQTQQANAQAGQEVEEPERPFFFFSAAYWGVMFVIFGAIMLVIAPSYTVAKARASTNSVIPQKPEPAPPVTFPDLKMQGVVFRQPNPSVLINGHTYFTGDTVGETKVVAIGPTNVTLELHGQTKILNLEE
jgi:hypothetical protein